MLAPEKLRELLSYDRDTGFFRWNVKRNHLAEVGQRAGHRNAKNGYRYVMISGKLYREHRLAWLYIHGEWPDIRLDIDHINRVRDDNRISNLRLVTRRTNVENSAVFKGRRCTFNENIRGQKKWRLRFCHNGIRFDQLYSSEAEAIAAFSDAMRKCEEPLGAMSGSSETLLGMHF